jgi:NhaP-type Na+/H+ or K+/H+ antiporter
MLAVALFAAAVVVYVAVGGRLASWRLTAPMVFTAVGVLAAVLGGSGVTGSLETEQLRTLTEATLALILFHDAAHLRPREMRGEAGFYVRLLLIGLPLTILLGLGTAYLLFPAATLWLALYIASALAPTDAGLGAPTVLNPVVPARIRRILNVESGLNDGLSTPVVLLAIAGLEASETGGEEHIAVLREILIGAAAGLVIGVVAGLVLAAARDRHLMEPSLAPIGVLATPLLAYYGAQVVSGNGFVAAFVAGVSFATAYSRTDADAAREPRAERDHVLGFTDLASVTLSFAVWTLFGVVATTYLVDDLTWQAGVFALLSLTVLRMLPVALCLLGTGLRAPTVAFIGWFGPRGMASVVFLLLAVQALGDDPTVTPYLAAIGLTVVASVILHGATAGPWAARYGDWAARTGPRVETAA